MSIQIAPSVQETMMPSGPVVELDYNNTAHQICRAAKPDADAGWCEHILWGRTPYPCGAVSAQSLYRAASGLARAERNGLLLCDMCLAVAAPGTYLCPDCESALSAVRAEPSVGPSRNAEAE